VSQALGDHLGADAGDPWEAHLALRIVTLLLVLAAMIDLVMGLGGAIGEAIGVALS
jgi:hypothetical protein